MLVIDHDNISINRIWILDIVCERCGVSDMYMAKERDDAVNEAIDEGWSVGYSILGGFRILCPKCHDEMRVVMMMKDAQPKPPQNAP